MSQYPAPGFPPQQPGYYAPYGQPQVPLRPTAVTVLAIFGIIFGALGVLCKPVALAGMFVPQPPGANPVVDMQRQMLGWNVASTVVGVAISILLLAGSIGSLNLKTWARPAMLAYAGLAVLMTLVNLVVTLVWIVPAMKQMQQQMPQQGAPASAAAIMQAAGTVGAVVGAALALIFPALLAYFYTRPNVKAAFGAPHAQGGAAGAGGYYGGPPAAAGGYYGQPPGQYPPGQNPPGQYPPQQ